MNKSSLRAEARAALGSVNNRAAKESAVTEKALDFVKDNRCESVAVYLSFGKELSTDALVRGLFEANKRVFAPITTENFDLVFTRIYPNSEYSINGFGIREPVVVNPESEFDVVFVPLLGFDGNNRRLGRGKGCYDKFLASSNAKKIGLAFAEQKFDFVPTDENDVVLDDVIYF